MMIKNILVPLPVDEKDEIDENYQKIIAENYELLSSIKKVILEKQNKILLSKVAIDSTTYLTKEIPLSILFDISKGKAKYTRKYGELHKGAYPVYSASNNVPLTDIDSYDYDGQYMTWATNGFAGTIRVLDGKFSINGDRGILVPKDERTDLDFNYMRFTLEPIFRELAKGRKGDKGEDEFTKLYPSMISTISVPVPVDEKGNISLQAQKEIAHIYLIIEQCKKEIANNLNALIQQKVSF